jgi:hypothetical protein
MWRHPNCLSQVRRDSHPSAVVCSRAFGRTAAVGYVIALRPIHGVGTSPLPSPFTPPAMLVAMSREDARKVTREMSPAGGAFITSPPLSGEVLGVG